MTEFDHTWKGEYQMAEPSVNPIYFGIDPDLKRSGTAMVVDGRIQYLGNMPFHDLMTWIEENPGYIYSLENVNMNKALFAKHSGKGARIRERIAQNVGQVKAVATLIQEKLEAVGCAYELVTPLKGHLKKAKADAKLFNALTGWQGKSNADNRDAAMLLYRYMKN